MSRICQCLGVDRVSLESPWEPCTVSSNWQRPPWTHPDAGFSGQPAWPDPGDFNGGPEVPRAPAEFAQETQVRGSLHLPPSQIPALLPRIASRCSSALGASSQAWTRCSLGHHPPQPHSGCCHRPQGEVGSETRQAGLHTRPHSRGQDPTMGYGRDPCWHLSRVTQE